MKSSSIDREAIVAEIAHKEDSVLHFVGRDGEAKQNFLVNCAEMMKRLEAEPKELGVSIRMLRMIHVGTITARNHQALMAFLQNADYVPELNTFHFERDRTRTIS